MKVNKAEVIKASLIVILFIGVLYFAISNHLNKTLLKDNSALVDKLVLDKFRNIATTSKASQEREVKLVVKFDSLKSYHLKYVSDLKAEQYRNKINHTKIDKIKNSELQRFNDSLFKFMNIH